MDEKQKVRVSKFLSKHLRHTPAEIGLTPEPGGWVGVDALLAAAAAHGVRVTRAELDEIVATSDKQRFAFDDLGTRIRANQGHSADVELTFDRAAPPDVLYHGTAESSLDSILRTGLAKMRRHHVHLSANAAAAATVGARHGKPVVLAVAAARMSESGFEFYLSANGVWLVDSVPPEYLSVACRE